MSSLGLFGSLCTYNPYLLELNVTAALFLKSYSGLVFACRQVLQLLMHNLLL